VNTQTLKLTTYFGELARSHGELLADQLIGLYQQRRVRASVTMRGVEGFGESHREHTDMLLTLSQDLPVVTVAVDSSERIEELLPAVLAIRTKGLVTIERARLITGDQLEVPAALPGDLIEQAKLSLYIGRHERVGGRPAFVAICELLQRCGMYGATVLLGVDGTRRGQRARAKLIGRNAEVPMLLMSVGPGEAVTQALGALRTMLPEVDATLERVSITRRDGVRISDPRPGEPVLGDGSNHRHKLTIYTSGDDRHGDHPLHREIVRRLRTQRLAGATSLMGIWGFHDDGRPRGDRLLQARRHTPVITIACDTPERIAAAYPEVEQLTAESGLVTIETVPVLGLSSSNRAA
jgi:PII-like signaling protein